MMCSEKKQFRKDGISYASASDFCAVFKAHTDSLYQFAFLLTGDHEKAEQCFVGGLQDSVKENHVFKEWAHSWAKRAILRNAIRALRPSPNASSSSFPVPNSPETHFDAGAILGLGSFERFVFVMSVLEHYSEHECSLLLGCSPREIREARTRALTQLASSHCSARPQGVSFGPSVEAFIKPDDRGVAANQ